MRNTVWMLAAVAGLSLMIAGCGDLSGSPADSSNGTPSQPATSAGSGSDVDATRSATSSAASDQPPIFVLKSGPLLYGRLATELARQTVLATAAEDSGVAVCDGSLTDDLPEGATNILPCYMAYQRSARTKKEAAPPRFDLFCLKRDDLRKPVPVLRLDFPEAAEPAAPLYGGYGPRAKSTRTNTGQKPADLERIAIATAEWTDEIEPFITELAHAAAPAKSDDSKPGTSDDAPSSNGDDPEVDIELRLREMTLVSQFEAVRAAHRLPPGAEKNRLLALGYANLGMLSQHHFSHRWKVFAARGIVYGVRYAKAEPGPLAEEVQAYTTALAGLHGAALKHIEAAGDERSECLEVIDAYCRMNTDELLDLVKQRGEFGELAAVLACLTIEGLYSEADQAAVYAAAIEANPDCYRVYDCAFFSALIGLHHDATERGPAQLAQSLPRRLASVADLPGEVREVLDDDELLTATIADRLEAVPDPIDSPAVPTWRVLGEMIREEALVQSIHRMQFLGYMLGVPTSDECEVCRAVVGDHPLAAILEAYSDQPDFERLNALAKKLSTRVASPTKADAWSMEHDFVPRQQELVLTLMHALEQESLTISMYDMVETFDWVTEDLVDHSFRNRAIEGMMFTRPERFTALNLISPHHPTCAKARINWVGTTDEELVACEQKYADRPAILVFLANVLNSRKNYDGAIRVATRVTETAPSYESYRVLAEANLAAGNKEEYIAAAEKSFEQPNFGLKADRFRSELAYYYMARGDFNSARPHADAAAETYSAWGIACAIDCYTGLKEWDVAEQWLVRKIQRYPGHAHEWYAWCRWTGHGHEEQAKEIADAMIESLRDTPPEKMTVPQILMLSYYCLIAGDNLRAGDLREHLAEREQNPAGALIAAVCYMRAGQREQALAILKKGRTWTTSNPNAPGAARRAGMFLDAFTRVKPITPDVIRQLDQDVETFDIMEHITFRAYYGDLLVRLGHREEGLAMLDRSASPRVTHDINAQERYAQAYAAITLREHRAEAAAESVREDAARQAPVEAPQPQA